MVMEHHLVCTMSRELGSRPYIIFSNCPESSEATALTAFPWKKEDIGEGQDGHGRENYTETGHLFILEPKYGGRELKMSTLEFMAPKKCSKGIDFWISQPIQIHVTICHPNPQQCSISSYLTQVSQECHGSAKALS